ncbi:hypothetical protein [Halomonas sp. E19]|uniref:hypothetical protein n=1 Tax=Halomonas sp. E19 TaxID=3397247 RepID=UPI0040340E37
MRQAIGFSVARGDEIAVVNSPFSRTIEEVEVLEWWQEPEMHELATTVVRYFLIALGVLLGYLLVLRPLIKRHTRGAAAGYAAEPRPARADRRRQRGRPQRRADPGR